MYLVLATHSKYAQTFALSFETHYALQIYGAFRLYLWQPFTMAIGFTLFRISVSSRKKMFLGGFVENVDNYILILNKYSTLTETIVQKLLS